MFTIDIAILRGRYHATPWGRHVNEGVPEWPPSPFRLLRALYDAWRRKRPEWPLERVEPILRALAAEDPWFELPPARSSHIRVFYRQGGEAESDKKLVFDPFVIVDPGSQVRIAWPSTDLSGSMWSDLDELVRTVGYLGRTESLVSLRVSDAPVNANCSPLGATDVTGGSELVRVAAVARPDEHLTIELIKAKKGKPGKPLSWIEALTWGTVEVQTRKLSDPPALRWVRYRRKTDALETRSVRTASGGTARRVDTVLLSIQGRVRPRVEDTVMIAEELRRLAMGAHKKVMGGDARRGSLTFAGKSNGGAPGKDHQHAYYLPWDRDGDGRLDHIVVHAAGGFDRSEITALDRIEWPARMNNDQPLAVLPVATGTRSMFDPVVHFRSATPFIPTHHYRPKRDGDYVEWLTRQLELELERHRISPLARSPVLMADDDRSVGRARRWLEYRRARRGATPKLGYGFRIELSQPVNGPFAIGSASHFGLGLFVPARE